MVLCLLPLRVFNTRVRKPTPLYLFAYETARSCGATCPVDLSNGRTDVFNRVLYERISNVSNLLNFAFVGLVPAPIFDVWWTAVLPLVAGSALLQLAVTEDVRLWALNPALLAILVGTAVGYPVIGYGFIATSMVS